MFVKLANNPIVVITGSKGFSQCSLKEEDTLGKRVIGEVFKTWDMG